MSLPGPRPGIAAFCTEAAHRALAEELPARVSAFSLDQHDPGLVVDGLRASGLFRYLVPESSGGAASPSGQPGSVDVRTLCMVRECLGYLSPMADSIFAVQGLGSYALVRTPAFPGRDRILAEVVSGQRICGFGLTEPEAGSDVASMRCEARREGDGWLLEGEKIFISNVGIARHFIVFASADRSLGKKGISAFLVDAASSGLVLEPIPMSVAHPFGRLLLQGCRAELIGEVGQGMRLALGTLDVFRTSVGAAACGMARRAFDEALEHVRTRKQFGVPLAELQLTQAALADMLTELEASRLLVYRAAATKDSGEAAGEAAGLHVAMAKMYATEAAQRIIDRAVQLFGGRGVVTGNVAEQLYREIRPLRIYEGTTEVQKLIIGGALARGARP